MVCCVKVWCIMTHHPTLTYFVYRLCGFIMSHCFLLEKQLMLLIFLRGQNVLRLIHLTLLEEISFFVAFYKTKVAKYHLSPVTFYCSKLLCKPDFM